MVLSINFLGCMVEMDELGDLIIRISGPRISSLIILHLNHIYVHKWFKYSNDYHFLTIRDGATSLICTNVLFFTNYNKPRS